MKIIVGNFIALLASLAMVYAGILKDKKKILYTQTIQCALFIISNIILGGIPGAIVNFLSCIRNILCYHNRLKSLEKIILIVLSIILTIMFNDLGFIGLLPTISTILYILFMNTKNIFKFKYLVLITTLLWLIYDICIKSYTSFIFDVFCIIATLISLLQLKNKKETKHA